MKLLRIDLSLSEPAYEQIVRGLRALLVQGELQPGDALPGVRQLALDLGLNHNTVAEAYRMLAQEGWIDLRQGRSATVLPRSNPKPTRRAAEQLGKRARELITKAIADGMSRAAIADLLESEAIALKKGDLS
jgi:GntR family transcriptional regulator